MSQADLGNNILLDSLNEVRRNDGFLLQAPIAGTGEEGAQGGVSAG